MGLTVFLGLPPAMRAQAARLYWEAFGGKLDRVLGPEPRALVFFERVIRADHCLAAIAPDGRLIGIAGFKTPQGSFAGGSWGDLTAVYGALGGRWRGCLLWALGRDVDNDSFLVDGICVTRDARGQGVGSLLLAALYDEARGRGYGSIRLDVIDARASFPPEPSVLGRCGTGSAFPQPRRWSARCGPATAEAACPRAPGLSGYDQIPHTGARP